MAVRRIKIVKFFLLLLLSTLLSCKDEYKPSQPQIKYDETSAIIQFMPTDHLVKDTAIITIGSIVKDRVPINNLVTINRTVTYKIRERLQRFDQMQLSYFLSLDSTFVVNVKTYRGIDTSFVYNYNCPTIEPVKIAKVISGECAELRDVNVSRDFIVKIKNWLFDNEINPDSQLISKMNNYLKRMNYSSIKEYGMKGKTIPVINKIENQKYKFDVDIAGDYFYLIAFQDSFKIRSFVKERIAEGLTDAKRTTKETFHCYNQAKHGINTLLLIAIDKNWKYCILPVGMIAIDKNGPFIRSIGHIDDCYNLPKSHVGKPGLFCCDIIGASIIKKAKDIIFKEQNIRVNVPKNDINIDSYVTFVHGDINHRNHGNYFCQLKVFYTGDLTYVTIAGKKYSVKKIEESEYIQAKIKDNERETITVVAEDRRGNVTKDYVKITPSFKSSAIRAAQLQQLKTYQYRKTHSSYNDLENRIGELENENEEQEDLINKLKNRIYDLESELE